MLAPGQFNRLRETRFPVRFRLLAETVEHEAETITFSLERLIIVSQTKLPVGEHLSLSIRFPAVSDVSFCEADFTGDVICGVKLADGKFGCQIEIKRNSFHIALKQSLVRSQSS